MRTCLKAFLLRVAEHIGSTLKLYANFPSFNARMVFSTLQHSNSAKIVIPKHVRGFSKTKHVSFLHEPHPVGNQTMHLISSTTQTSPISTHAHRAKPLNRNRNRNRAVHPPPVQTPPSLTQRRCNRGIIPQQRRRQHFSPL